MDVHSQLAAFQAGGRYASLPLAELALSDRDLAILSVAIRAGPDFVAEQAIELLLDAGRRTDPLWARGGAVIQHGGIVAVLASVAVPLGGATAEAALQALHAHVPAEGLRPHAEVLLEALATRPSTTLFLVIAKAKLPAAAPLVRTHVAAPRWRTSREARMAMAALGDPREERIFVDALSAANTPSHLTRAAELAGWVGTEPCLAALAGQVRTPMVLETQNFRRSVRLDIVRALSFNFPVEPRLFESGIRSDRDYEQVEQFCQQRFGTAWAQPRPPFLTVQGFPRG